MLNRLKKTGLLALIFSAGLAVMQPAVASAQDWHDRDGHYDRDRRDRDRRDWREDRHDWRDRHEDRREYRDRDRRDYDRGYLYFNYSQQPRYTYRAYPYNNYPTCPY